MEPRCMVSVVFSETHTGWELYHPVLSYRGKRSATDSPPGSLCMWGL